MEILTIGHGDQPIESFIELLRQHRVEVLIDTRSKPYSTRNPQFGQRVLATFLDDAGIRYVFLGDKLGGKPRDVALYDAAGRPDYERIAAGDTYKRGIDMLLELARGDENVAIMCSESDFRECHRYKLVSRTLAIGGVEVQHIMRDGTLEPNPAPQLALFATVVGGSSRVRR
jgi:uncharacterized protein (DUF488 family)